MSSPRRAIPTEQIRAFDLAVCERLGLNPAEVSTVNFEALGGEPTTRVTVTAWLPTSDVLHMFNTGRVPS